MDETSGEDLQAFELVSSGLEPPGMPDPEPEILERAQKILDRVADGEAFSTAGSQAEVESAGGFDQIDDEEKLRFLALLLGNRPFEKWFFLFGGRFNVCFRTISAHLELEIKQMLLEEEGRGLASAADRRLRYDNYMLAASLHRVKIDDQRNTRIEVFVGSASSDDRRRSYAAWLSELDSEHYRLLRTCYLQFRNHISFLMRKADDQDFWPTPS